MLLNTLARAADPWRNVLAYNEPPDWLRTSCAAANLLHAHLTELFSLLDNQPVDLSTPFTQLVVEGRICHVWRLL